MEDTQTRKTDRQTETEREREGQTYKDRKSDRESLPDIPLLSGPYTYGAIKHLPFKSRPLGAGVCGVRLSAGIVVESADVPHSQNPLSKHCKKSLTI